MKLDRILDFIMIGCVLVMVAGICSAAVLFIWSSLQNTPLVWMPFVGLISVALVLLIGGARWGGPPMQH